VPNTINPPAFFSLPNIEVRPSVEEVQRALIQVGQIILSVTKGVAQWKTAGKVKQPALEAVVVKVTS